MNLARGFAPGYPVLLPGEPSASRDAANRTVVVAPVAGAKARGAAIVGIVHDAGMREAAAGRVFEAAPLQDAA